MDDMGQKYRAQILLEPEQHKTLQQIAARERRSLSDVAREVIRIGLEARDRDLDALWQKRLDALERLKRIRDEGLQKYGIYQGDLLAEARSERESQTNETLHWTAGK